MAEHDDKNFEQKIEKMLREMDSEIEIPEIPDVQNIFEKAEEKKQNVVPFKKYSKYVAAAAAVVLICISFPAFSGTFGRSLPQEAAESFDQSMEYLSDGICEEAEMPMEPEAAAEPETAYPETPKEPEETDLDSNDALREESESEIQYAITVSEALSKYFTCVETAVVSGSQNSSSVAQEEKSEMEDAKILEEYLNKKRSIDLTIGKESVSVILKDISADEEIISAFWVEGKFEGSYLDGEYYFINLVKNITLEDYAEGNYLPMVGDEAEEPYTIPEESIYIPGEVTEGIITLVVEINIGTGEYKIYASLI
ncbi:MAG: hypothetical protein IJA05_07140 [Oscillospiraceae bacterium]|nr:hypothetical protein [Oscillospiraceae bacterium]